MKRDMDLIRRILVETEKADKPLDIADMVTSAYDFEMVKYHARLLDGFGLVDFEPLYADDDVYDGRVHGLTWAGCDYLDAIRDDRVWRKAKRVIADTVGDTTLDVIKQVAVKVAVSMALAAL